MVGDVGGMSKGLELREEEFVREGGEKGGFMRLVLGLEVSEGVSI